MLSPWFDYSHTLVVFHPVFDLDVNESPKTEASLIDSLSPFFLLRHFICSYHRHRPWETGVVKLYHNWRRRYVRSRRAENVEVLVGPAVDFVTVVRQIRFRHGEEKLDIMLDQRIREAIYEDFNEGPSNVVEERTFNGLHPLFTNHLMPVRPGNPLTYTIAEKRCSATSALLYFRRSMIRVFGFNALISTPNQLPMVHLRKTYLGIIT